MAVYSFVVIGVFLMLTGSIANGLIIPRLRQHSRQLKALLKGLSMYMMYVGLGIIVLGLFLLIDIMFQKYLWYRISIWITFVLFIVIILGASVWWVATSVTLRRHRPLKIPSFHFPKTWYIVEVRSDFSKSPKDRITCIGGTWDDVVRVRPHLSKPRERTGQNHIICLDGTWNDAVSQTNIENLFKLLSDKCYNGEPQIKRYYTGVGINERQGSAAEVWGEEVTKGILQSATGLGERRIRWLAYFDLVATYQPGDRVFIFGFSRGASSARILANHIFEYGISELTQAEFQRAPLDEGKPFGPDKLRDLAVVGDKKINVGIEMMGLWDTVAAFGLPSNKFEPFRKLSIPDNVKKVYHLVAIDEKRWEFDATLIKHDARNDRIEEIWFSGAHTNVGGGSGDNKLSDIALRFMINRALEHGLCFESEWESKLKDDVGGPEWPLWPLWPKWFSRRIRVEGGEPEALPRIHKSVFERASVIKYERENLRKVEEKYALEERD